MATATATATDEPLGALLLELLAPPGGDLDGAAAIAIARRLAGLFLDGADRAGRRPSLAPATLERLRAAARREAADDLAIARETDEVLSLLESLSPLIFKGRALAFEAWPRPELRPPGDLDLLAEPGAVAEAASRLRARGYRPAPREPPLPLRRPDTGTTLLPPPGRRLVVDLHERPFRSVGHRIDPARLLARARPALVGGRAVRALDEADRLLLVAVHAAKHGGRELKWLLDLHALARRATEATWSRLARRARATGTARPLWAALVLLDGLPGVALDGILRALRPPPPWPRLLRSLIARELAVAGAPLGRAQGYALEVALEPSLPSRARMAAGLLARLALAWMPVQKPGVRR
ncbi:MAG TPA: nucleotidyltransferase family protein [Polyangiaceae bacterium]|nr:nucleotidyltransferase family protein [Polyangiaceae bacterium]